MPDLKAVRAPRRAKNALHSDENSSSSKTRSMGAVGGAVAAVPLCVAKGRAAAGGAHPLEEGEFLLTQGGAAVLPSPTFLYCIKKEGTPASLG